MAIERKKKTLTLGGQNLPPTLWASMTMRIPGRRILHRKVALKFS